MSSIKSLLFDIDLNSDAPQHGALLVAEPFLRERFFNHAVICLVEYAKGKNTMGIVLNIETDINLQSIVAEVTNPDPIPVFCGGPLSNDRLYYLHTLGDIIPDAKEIIPGLYIGGDFNAIIDYVNSEYPIDNKIRFFIGYSGWDIGQLEEELRKNVWAVTTIDDCSSLFHGANNAYWHNIVRRMGSKYRGWLYHPTDPTVN